MLILVILLFFGVLKIFDIINNKNFILKIFKKNVNCSKKWYNNYFFFNEILLGCGKIFLIFKFIKKLIKKNSVLI